MRYAIYLLIALVAAYYAHDHAETVEASTAAHEAGGSEVSRAYEQRRTAHQLKGSGTVVRILPDDDDGSRHQRFIVGLPSGQTVLIAHNIDLAPRIEAIRTGDRVAFFGEYEWNDKGGLIHWTHHDPQGRHVAGWVEHNGRRYQ